VEDRGAVDLLIAGKRVELSAAVMADVGEPPIAVLANQRLGGAARLQVVETDQPHVAHVGPLLRRDAVIANDAQPRQGNPDRRGCHVRTSHVTVPFRTGPGAPRNLGDDTPAVAFRQRKGTWLPGTVPGASGGPRRAGGAPANVRWRTGGFPGADRIELPGLVDRGERVDPAAAEFQARTGHEVDDRSRDEDLAALRQPCDAHADVHDDPV